jgi:hypothetical protein
MMKEKVARLTSFHEPIKRTKGKIEQNKKQKPHLGVDKSANLTLVWGPSIVVCLTVT